MESPMNYCYQIGMTSSEVEKRRIAEVANIAKAADEENGLYPNGNAIILYVDDHYLVYLFDDKYWATEAEYGHKMAKQLKCLTDEEAKSYGYAHTTTT